MLIKMQLAIVTFWRKKGFEILYDKKDKKHIINNKLLT